MNSSIKSEATRRGITRLCHLTPFHNLVHIATGDGLRSTRYLSTAERRAFNQQDIERLDNHPDHISCSIEFPNAWYLRKRRQQARGEALLFPDWVCVCIAPRPLWAETTLFCPRNAAAQGGRLVEAGAAAFSGLFAESVSGSGRTYTRTKARLDACPTDDQAEVLVHRHIPLEDAHQIVVADESQAQRAFFGLTQIGVPHDRFEYVICPDFFNPSLLSTMIQEGRRPVGVVWNLGSPPRA